MVERAWLAGGTCGNSELQSTALLEEVLINLCTLQLGTLGESGEGGGKSGSHSVTTGLTLPSHSAFIFLNSSLTILSSSDTMMAVKQIHCSSVSDGAYPSAWV